MTDEELIQAVWEKGRVVLGHDPARWRKDDCGAWIGREFYQNQESEFGWEIDRIDLTGPVNLTNLRPLHWKNSADKIDGLLKCYITGAGNENVDTRE